MFRFDDDLRIYLHREPIDFRAGLNTLVTMVEQSMQLDPRRRQLSWPAKVVDALHDPLARAVFAFHNRKRDRVKLLLYDRAGFWLMLKRLEVDRFAWPRRQQAVIELTVDQLHLLLDGVDIDALRRHPARQYCVTS
ncbi:IS66 family insertion sequence element accessory protein TnpB [Burkholderia ubonensis]|uniref:IS66 family insertion sequence element accessory protein TnpB n=1 Tax=Burkholderia ubonensis TaxID=101571 RepID=UPI0007581E8F|nr:IS66 family insertion sequence element accessory protein TnpB [Burkholderia ubonensis]KVN50341.1 transposase [Burkholderia ubonensis]